MLPPLECSPFTAVSEDYVTSGSLAIAAGLIARLIIRPGC
jgi:hypothetical protein